MNVTCGVCLVPVILFGDNLMTSAFASFFDLCKIDQCWRLSQRNRGNDSRSGSAKTQMESIQNRSC